VYVHGGKARCRWYLVEVDVGVEVGPVDVAGVQGLGLVRGFALLVHPVVELQHAVDPVIPRRPGLRGLHLSVHDIYSIYQLVTLKETDPEMT